MSSPSTAPTDYSLNMHPNGPYLAESAYQFLAVGFTLIVAYVGLTVYLRWKINKERVEKDGEENRARNAKMSMSDTQRTSQKNNTAATTKVSDLYTSNDEIPDILIDGKETGDIRMSNMSKIKTNQGEQQNTRVST